VRIVDRDVIFERHGGVHEPSPFTEVLANGLPDCSGMRCVDAGAGAGAISLAMLIRGAREVVALEWDPVALLDARRNVERELGRAQPLRLVEGDFTDLLDFPADLVASNPPQRPRLVWEQSGADAGFNIGGEDGLDAVRSILVHARAPQVVLSLSSLVCPDPTALGRRVRYACELLLEHPVEHDAAWSAIGPLDGAGVRVWRFTRAI